MPKTPHGLTEQERAEIAHWCDRVWREAAHFDAVISRDEHRETGTHTQLVRVQKAVAKIRRAV